MRRMPDVCLTYADVCLTAGGAFVVGGAARLPQRAPPARVPPRAPRFSVYLFYWYKSTNTDAEGAAILELLGPTHKPPLSFALFFVQQHVLRKKNLSLKKKIGAEQTAILVQLGLLRARLFSTYEHMCFIEP